MKSIRYALLNKDATMPSRKHPTDAGVDVFAAEAKTVAPFSCEVIKTGVTFEIPDGYMMQVWPKSRSNFLIGAGIIDSGYQGEVLVKVVNFSSTPLEFSPGDPVAQLVLVPTVMPYLLEVRLEEVHVSGTERGATGGIIGQ